jgi:serine kinase of HPr protein (carbohydrate metabolism regulator)
VLLGPSGSGKSDLALRLIERTDAAGEAEPAGAFLVADDRVLIEAVDDGLIARAPDTLRGRLEVRGVGVLAVPYIAETKLHVAVSLGPDARGDRIPDFDRQVMEIAGVTLAHLFLDPFQASASAKIRAVTRAMTSGGFADQVAADADA